MSLFKPKKKVEIKNHQRGLLFRNNKLVRVLKPGAYKFFDVNNHLDIWVGDVSEVFFNYPHADLLVSEYPKQLNKDIETIKVDDDQVALVYQNNTLRFIIPAGSTRYVWRAGNNISVRKIDIGDSIAIEQDVKNHIKNSVYLNDSADSKSYMYGKTLSSEHSKPNQAFMSSAIPASHVGVLTVDGKITEVLQPGVHSYWTVVKKVDIQNVDMRVQSLDISGQEILTKDKVSLRINLVANFQITDAKAMLESLQNHEDFIYKHFQLGLRDAIGTKTLEELLSNKDEIGAVVNEYASSQLSQYGINVNSVGVKDIILPGEMKTLLNKVVEAEKVAQANVIRRREETAATRSLHNTAKMLENNPVLLRLKELETLEKVTERIDKISVVGGLDSVLNDLVRINT